MKSTDAIGRHRFGQTLRRISGFALVGATTVLAPISAASGAGPTTPGGPPVFAATGMADAVGSSPREEHIVRNGTDPNHSPTDSIDCGPATHSHGTGSSALFPASFGGAGPPNGQAGDLPLPLRAARVAGEDSTVIPQWLNVPDNRTLDTANETHTRTVKIFYQLPNGVWSACTGSLIGPREVLTAGHCVYNQDTTVSQTGWDVSAYVVPGMKDDYFPSGWARGLQFWSSSNWTGSGSSGSQPGYDWGIIGLDRPLGSLPGGYYGMLALSDDQLANNGMTQWIDGYPQDLPFLSTAEGAGVSRDVRWARMPYRTVRPYPGLDLYDDTTLTFDISAYKGESGSGDIINAIQFYPGQNMEVVTGVWHGILGGSNPATQMDWETLPSTFVRVTTDRASDWLNTIGPQITALPVVTPIAAPWVQIGSGQFTSAVTAVAESNGSSLFAVGFDGQVYWTGVFQSSGLNSGWALLPGNGIVGGQKLAALQVPNEDMFVFARGYGNPQAAYVNHYSHAANAWSGWQYLGGSLVDSLTAVFDGVGTVYLFGEGAGGDVQYTACNATNGSCLVNSWTSLGQNVIGEVPVSAISRQSGMIDIFVSDVSGSIFTREMVYGSWYPFAPLPAAFGMAGPPSAVSWGPDRIDLFAHPAPGQAVATSPVYHNAYNTSSGWYGWESRGGLSSGTTSVASVGSGQLTFLLWQLGTAFQESWNGSAWLPFNQGYTNLGGDFSEPPTLTYGNTTTLRAFGRSWDGSIWTRTVP